jgi:nicotinamide/nicotinate riboside kinase
LRLCRKANVQSTLLCLLQMDYRRMEAALRHFRKHGKLPSHHSSHDHLNEQHNLPLKNETTSFWKKAFQQALETAKVERVLIADGFLLYYDEGVRREMDIRLFLRCNRSTLIERREARGGYATAEGTVWQVSHHSRTFESANHS